MRYLLMAQPALPKEQAGGIWNAKSYIQHCSQLSECRNGSSNKARRVQLCAASHAPAGHRQHQLAGARRGSRRCRSRRRLSLKPQYCHKQDAAAMEPHPAAVPYARLSPLRLIGNVRSRLPLAANIALHTAGITGGSAGSPRPVGEFSVFLHEICICGVCRILGIGY